MSDDILDGVDLDIPFNVALMVVARGRAVMIPVDADELRSARARVEYAEVELAEARAALAKLEASTEGGR